MCVRRMDTGRVQALIIATASGHVIYERFYERFSDLDRAEIRAACLQALGADRSSGSAESVSRLRCASLTLFK